MTLAESLARKAAPCSEDRLCKHPGPMMGGKPRDLLHSYKCPARMRPAIVAAIEEAIAACAGLADRWSDDPVAQQIAVNIYALRTDDVEDGG